MPSKNLGRLAVALGLCCSLAAFNLAAEPLLSPAGLSTGGSSVSAGALQLTNNPAAPAAVRYSISGKRTLNSGFGLGVARAGIGYSYGQVDEIVNELDSLYDTLANDDDINASDLGNAASDTENLLQTVETEGYITADLSYSFFPAEVSSKKNGRRLDLLSTNQQLRARRFHRLDGELQVGIRGQLQHLHRVPGW